MPDSDEVFIEVKVTRYNIPRLRLGQILVPVAIIVTVVARRAPTMLPLALAFVLQAVGLVVLLSAVKRLGWQPLRVENAAVSFGSTSFRMERRQVRDWTLVGSVARLYGAAVSFRLQVRSGGEHALAALLWSQFGSPVSLDRRGSKRARVLALCAAVFGIAMSVLAIMNGDSSLAFVGAPALVFGIAALGALSQRVAQR